MTNLGAQLDQLERTQLVRQLVEEEPAYIFKHTLIQETAYQSLLKHERKQLHRVVGEALEGAYPAQVDENSGLLARHFAEAGDDAKTFTYALRAGDLAVRQYSYAEARVYYAQALQAVMRLGDSAENQRLYVDTILKQMRVTRLSVDPQENLAHLKQAETLTRSLLEVSEPMQEDRLRLARVYNWSGTIHVMRNELVVASHELEQALALARELDDPWLETRASSVLAGVMTLRGQFGKAVPLLTQLLDQYEKAGNWLEWVYTLAILGYSHAARGDYALGLAEGERAVERARALNNPTRLVEVMGTAVGIYFFGGDMPQFLAAAKQTLDVAEQLGERVYSFYYVQQALAESRLGDVEAALARLRRYEASHRGIIEQGFFADALAAFEAQITLNAGHAEEAILLAEKAVKVAQRVGGLFGGGFAERTWGQALARLKTPPYDEVERHFAESLHLFEEGDARLEAARTRVTWGNFLRARGELERAREMYEQAAAQFETSGLTRELSETRKFMSSEPIEN